jgi:hypothetical protein
MNNPYAFWRYDLFKLTVAVILLIILLLALPSSPAVGPSGEGTGIATVASPVTPPGESIPSIPLDPNGTTELPGFPQAVVELTPDDLNQNLLAPDGRIVYRLDEENMSWLPVITREVQDKLPAGTSLVKNSKAEWAIQTDQGETLYIWDGGSLNWVKQQTAPPFSNSDCPAQLQSRLQAGGKARVLTNLNMRSSPGIKNNWLLTNITGTELKVLAGPVCIVQVQGTFWWWEVENPAGLSGWSAEAQGAGYYYFLEPLTP